MNSRVITTLAQMARREPLRSLHRLCESQKQVSTAKLEDYLLCAGDELAGYAEILRDEFNNIAAAPAAPTADGTTSDKYRAELYDEVWQRARDMGYGNVTDALVELERMKVAAPAVQAEQEPVAVITGESFDCADGKGWRPSVEFSVKTLPKGTQLYAAPPAHPDAALVEALNICISALSHAASCQRGVVETCCCGKCAIDNARAALAGKGGEQPAELNPDDLKVDVWGIAVRDGVDMRCGSAVRIKHIPTGISVERSAERSQHANKEAALAVLTRLVAAQAAQEGK